MQKLKILYLKINPKNGNQILTETDRVYEVRHH